MGKTNSKYYTDSTCVHCGHEYNSAHSSSYYSWKYCSSRCEAEAEMDDDQEDDYQNDAKENDHYYPEEDYGYEG